MGPRNGAPATAKARLRASVTRYASRGAPRGDDPSRVRWVRFAKMRGSPLSCPLPLRERAQWSAHELERVRGSRITPLTRPRAWQHRAALSRKGRGRNNADRIRSLIHFSNSPSRSRDAFLRPGFATLLHSLRIEGWAERRETFGCSAKHAWGLHMTRQARGLARRLASHDAGPWPLAAPPWRLSTRGRASVSGMTRIRAASSSQPCRSAWRAGSRASRGKRLQAAAAGRHASLRLQDVSGDAPR